MDRSAVPVILQDQHGRLLPGVRIVFDKDRGVHADYSILRHDIICGEFSKPVARDDVITAQHKSLHAT
jgi:hypothetical protein